MTIYFYSTRDEYGCFSNFSNHGIKLKGKWWPTSEHYFQAQKFAGTPHEEEVRRAQTPKQAAEIGRDRMRPLRHDWEKVKDQVMREAVLEKFLSHADIQATLLGTGDQDLVENAPSDWYWGCGSDGTGKNMLGTILMEVRSEIRRQAQGPVTIHTLLVGQPQTMTDARGTWRSAIFRGPVTGPVELGKRGLAGDQVADTANHGSPDQAVCCHPLAHYSYWNEVYGLDTEATRVGPGGVGENWTIAGADEGTTCIGDVYRAGQTLVQVSAPRYPCIKQERKLGLPGFHRKTIETMRTGWYLRVLEPGVVQAGDELKLEMRPHPALTIARVNAGMHQEFDHTFARALLDVPELAAGWRRILQHRLEKETPG
jgi:ribA/ribD-fused uncharacterized protein